MSQPKSPFPHPKTWPVMQLRDLCLKIGSGATPTGGDSSYLNQRKTWAFVRSQNVFDRHFDTDGLAFINDDQAARLKGVELRPDDVLLNITGDGITFGRACRVAAQTLPAVVNQHVAIVRPDQRKLRSGFLLAYLTHPLVKPYIAGFNTGGSRRAVTKAHIESFEIPTPDVVCQDAISAVLDTIDDKIELNRRVSQTLEDIAQAIFKSWFVDFEHDWPSADWKRLPLDSVAEFLNGLALQKYPAVAGAEFLPVIKIAQLRAGHTKSADQANLDVPQPYVIHDGDLLFSWSGSLEVEFWCGGKGALNQHLFKVTPSVAPNWYAYFWTKHHLPEFRAIAANKATTMGHIQRKHLTAAEVLLPPPPVLKDMDKVMEPILAELIQRRLEIRTLTEVRDQLLPRLLSGELTPA